MAGVFDGNGLFLVMKSNTSQHLILEDLKDGLPPLFDIDSIELDECGEVHMRVRGTQVRYINSMLIRRPLCHLQALRSDNTKYGLMVYSGGFVLELDGHTYGAWSLERGGIQKAYRNDVYTSKCDGYEASLVLENNGSLTMKYQLISPGRAPVRHCSVPPASIRLQKLNQENETGLDLYSPFLKLTPTGELALYKLDMKQQTWVVDSVLLLDSICTSVLACGLYSVCDLDGKCNKSLSNGITSEGSRDLLYAQQHKLNWRRKGVSYISTSMRPDIIKTTLEVCADQRSSAVFYSHSTRNCYLMWSLPSGSLHRDENVTTFINYSIENDSTTSYTRIILAYGALIFVIVSPVVIVTLAIIFLAIVQAKLNGINSAKEVEMLLSSMQGLPQRFSYTELEVATRGFMKKVGTGGFGSVYEGFTKDARHVAVKKLTINDNGTESAKQFVMEIAGIGGVSHLNIVKLYGFCIDGASQKLLVYEFMPNGSLERWLFEGERTLSWEKRLSIALGTTARGLCYLHEECSEPILHLDIKPQNILLDDKFEAKVADFGLAKMLTSREVTRVETNVRGTPGYMAPEWLVQFAATKKCDVYSYGMLLLELIGGRKNVDIARINDNDSSWYFPSWVVDRIKQKQYLEVVDPRVRDTASPETVEVMVKVALWCIQENPVARPSMGEVVEMLQKHKEVQEPPMSFCFDRAYSSDNSERGIFEADASV